MNIFTKVVGLVRKSVSELTDAVTDIDGQHKTTATEQLTDQVQSARASLSQSQQTLTKLEAHQRGLELNLATNKEQIATLEKEAIAALNAKDEHYALAVAENISRLTKDQHKEALTLRLASEATEREQYRVDNAKRVFEELEREAAMIQVTQTVQETTAQLRDQLDTGKGSLTSARETLDRIKAKQQTNDDLQAAEDEIEQHQDINQQMQDAGIEEDPLSPESIIEKLKKGNF